MLVVVTWRMMLTQLRMKMKEKKIQEMNHQQKHHHKYRAIAETEKTHVDWHSTIPGRVANSNPSVTKSEVVRMLGFNRYFSNREVRVNHRILAIKHCPDKWIERRVLTKEDGMETPKSNVSAFDCLK